LSNHDFRAKLESERQTGRDPVANLVNVVQTTGRKSLTPLLFVALALAWGSSFFFIKISLEGLSPAQIVLFRLVLGALTLNAVLFATRRRWPRDGKLLGHLAVVGCLMCAVPLLLFAWAGQFIPSGLSSIYNATTPLMTMIVALAVIPTEKGSPARVGGIILGAVGILIVLGPWNLFIAANAYANSGWAQGACLLGAVSYGFAFAYMRRFVAGHNYDARSLAAAQVTLAAVMLVIPAPFILATPMVWNPAIVAAILVLGIVTSGIAYIWISSIVKAWGATSTSTVTYLTPLVGVILGVLVLGETLTWNQPIGAIVAIVGILISQGTIRFRPTCRGATRHERTTTHQTTKIRFRSRDGRGISKSWSRR